MANRPTDIHAADTGAAPRTGPLGRAARLVLAALLAWVGYDLWVDRALILAEPEAGPVLVAGLAGVAAYQAAALIGRGRLALAGLGVVLTTAAAVAVIREGMLWAPPLSWLVWGLDIGLVALVSGTMLAAVVVGTPGCEIGVLDDLTRRLRSRAHRAEATFCLVGLHKLDDWEARQGWHNPPGPG